MHVTCVPLGPGVPREGAGIPGGPGGPWGPGGPREGGRVPGGPGGPLRPGGPRSPGACASVGANNDTISRSSAAAVAGDIL